MKQEKFWGKIWGLFLSLRGLTILGVWLGWKFLPFKSSFPYADAVLFKYGSPLFWSWANFDGVHYLMLSKEGYAFGLTQAFFPLYHLLIRWGTFFIQNRLLTGLVISHLAFLGVLVLFYKLVRLDFSEKISYRAVVSLAVFPTAFFFFSIYTESWFLFLVLASFYWARKRRWLWSGLLGALAAATRIVGVFLVPALLYEYWTTRKKKKPSEIMNTLLPLSGLLAYMGYLQVRFHDPFLFAHVQEGFGAGRTTDKLVLLYQVFWRYSKMIFTVDPNNPIYFIVWLEILAAVGFLGLLIWAWAKGIRKSYLIFSILAYILPTLTGTFSSMPRYVLVLFPAFIVLGTIKNSLVYRMWLGVSISLLIVATMLFTRGYWVA